MSFNFMCIHIESVYWQVITEPGLVAWEHGFAFPRIESLKPEWRGTPMNYRFKLIAFVCVCACMHAHMYKLGRRWNWEEARRMPYFHSQYRGRYQHRRLKTVKGFSHRLASLWGLWMCLAAGAMQGHLCSQQDAPGVFRAPDESPPAALGEAGCFLWDVLCLF